MATLVTRPGATLVPNRIVVAPLANRTGDTTLASIGEMAADWIARGLTRTAQFEVVDPRTAWMTAKLVDRIPRLLRPGEAAIAIAEETGSGLVVSGSYYRAGDSLRFEVQITDVAIPQPEPGARSGQRANRRPGERAPHPRPTDRGHRGHRR